MPIRLGTVSIFIRADFQREERGLCACLCMKIEETAAVVIERSDHSFPFIRSVSGERTPSPSKYSMVLNRRHKRLYSNFSYFVFKLVIILHFFLEKRTTVNAVKTLFFNSR